MALPQPEPALSTFPSSTSFAAKLKFDGFRCGFAPIAAFSRFFRSEQPVQPEPAPFAFATSTSLAAKVKFDGFRSGLAPIAAFSRLLQPAQPESPVLAPSVPDPSSTAAATLVDTGYQSPVLKSAASELPSVMRLDAVPSPPSPKPSLTGICTNILHKASQITQKLVSPQPQPSLAPVDISSLLEMMARLSLNDKHQTSEVQITQPTPARSRRSCRKGKSKPNSAPALPTQTASQTDSKTAPQQSSKEVPTRPSGQPSQQNHPQAAVSKQVSPSPSSAQPSSAPAAAKPAKAEKKQNVATPAKAPTPATSKPSPKVDYKPLPKVFSSVPQAATPADPQRPSGQLALPSVPVARKPLPQGIPPKSIASSSSEQSSSAMTQAIPAETEKKETVKVSEPQPLPKPAVSTQVARPSSVQSSSAPAENLAKMGAIDPSLASLLDGFEEEETEVKAKKLEPKSQPKSKTESKTESKPKPESEVKVVPDDDCPEELELEDIENQLDLETFEGETIKEMKRVVKRVPKYEGNDRKIAPLKKRT